MGDTRADFLSKEISRLNQLLAQKYDQKLENQRAAYELELLAVMAVKMPPRHS